MKNQLKRNAKDKVFKNLLQNRENLAQFYYDLTGENIDPDEIIYDTIATSIVKGREEDVAFILGTRCIVLFEAQSTWSKDDIIRFAIYMYLLFINYVDEHEDEIFNSQNMKDLPSLEAYVIYTGNDNLSEMVSLEDLFIGRKPTMINAKMIICTFKNSKGMVREYIEFSKLETEYYTNNKRTKNDVIALINYCIKNNILKHYMLEHKKEVANLIENLFTEEKRIKGLIKEAVNEAQINEIMHLIELEIPKDQIIEVTGYPLELVEEVLKKAKRN